MAKKDTVGAQFIAPEQVDVLLKKPHTHAGEDYAPGDTITGMDKATAEWLVAEGVCECVVVAGSPAL